MASGTINFTQSDTSGSYIDGEIRWSSQLNSAANTSRVTASIYVRKANTDMTLTIPTTGTWSFQINIGGYIKSGSISTSVLRDWVLLGTVTAPDVSHDSDGSKIITISGSITAPSSTSFAGHSTAGNGPATLDTNPRATVLNSWTCSTGYVDGTITAYYTPRNPDYFNRCVVSINLNGSLTEIYTEDLGRKTANQQIQHTINLGDDALSTIYEKVKNSTSVIVRVTFRTYSDSRYQAQVGKDQFVDRQLSISLGIKPKVELAIVPVNLNSWINSKDIFVGGLSGATATLTAFPGEGAELESTTITYDGVTYNAVKLNVTTLKKSGDARFIGKVTDSRGRSAIIDKSIIVKPYSAPTIHSVKIERGKYESGWTANDNGADVRVYFITSLSLAEYANTYSVAFTLDGATITPDYGNPEGLKSGMDYAFHFLNVDSEHSHTLKISVTDLVGENGAVTAIIPTTKVTIEFNESGNGIAFGKTSEKNAFECSFDADFKKTVNIDGEATLNGVTTFNNIINPKKDINMGGLNGQYSELVIRFSNSSASAYTHNAYLYGGNPDKANAIGCYDGKYDRPIWSYDDTKNSISIGNSNSSISINGTKMIDFVIEEGEKDFWTYRKWYSGLLECWGTTTAVTLSFDGTAAGCYYGTTAPEFNFPTNSNGGSMFVDIPTVQQTCKSGSAIIVSAISHLNSENMRLTYGRFYGGKDNQDVHFHFYVRGKWK